MMKRAGSIRRSLLAATLSAVLAGGCTTPPGLPETLPDEKASLPVDWRAPEVSGSAASARDEWWRDFGDEELNRLIDLGRERSHDLLEAMANLDEAIAYAREVGADIYPEVSLEGELSASKSMNSATGALNRGRVVHVGAAASWELDFWGKNRKAREAALASADASLWAARAVRLSLDGSIAREYFALLAASESLRVAIDSLRLMEETRDVTRAKLSYGTATQTDFDLAASDCDTQAAVVSAWKLTLEQSLHALALLTATPDLSVNTVGKSLPAAPVVRPGIPSELLQRRPDVREAEGKLLSAHASVAVAYAAFFPSISLTASGGTQSRSLGGLFDHSVWSAGAGLDLPIFDFGRRSAAYEGALASERAALESYRKTAETAYSDVRDALSAAKYNLEIERSRAAAFASARLAALQAKNRYEAGSGDFLELLSAQRTMNSAALDLTSARSDTLSNIVALNLALGAGGGGPHDAQAGRPDSP